MHAQTHTSKAVNKSARNSIGGAIKIFQRGEGVEFLIKQSALVVAFPLTGNNGTFKKGVYFRKKSNFLRLVFKFGITVCR